VERRRHRFGAGFALATVFLLVAAACGDDGGGGGANGDTGGSSAPSTTAAQPQSGGTLTMAMFTETAGLDSMVSSGNGVTGAIEMTSIYDSVMRWNPETGKYEPRTAESLTSTDNTVWTLKIRPNIKFSDGTDYDAEAVRFSLDRHRSGLPGGPACESVRACPRNSTSSSGYMSNVKSMQVQDKLTLQITLTEPWAEFPWVLADEPGFVPSPTALKSACPEDKAKSPRDCPFNTAPVGAGPFVLDSYKPKDSITVKRNPNYWGGTVYLDAVKFINLGDGGADKTLEALRGGTAQVAFLRDAQAIAKARADKVPGLSAVQNAGAVAFMNVGLTANCVSGQPATYCAGKPDGPTPTNAPTRNVKLRQAIAAAIDPIVVDQRQNNGKGLPGSELLQKSYRYSPNVPGPKFDTERAKKLVAEAKAEGWDGKVRYLCNNSPAGQNRALAYEAQLRAVGIEPIVDTTKDITAMTLQYTQQRDFDIVCAGMPLSSDGNATAAMIQNLSPGGAGNRTGWNNAAVGTALTALKAATTDDAKKAALKTISEEIVKDAPFTVDGAVEEFIAYNTKVHGLVQTSGTEIYFDKAWLEK
jgi:peptide/nickel transport system substrate-binding protein